MRLRRRFAKPFSSVVAFASDAPTSRPPTRERISINSDWLFAKGDPPGAEGKLDYAKIKSWMTATGEELVSLSASTRSARSAEEFASDISFARVDFDDSEWRSLDLPHDWGIDGEFDIKAERAEKLPYAGIGWYRKHLHVSPSDLGKHFFLEIDGAMSYSSVWVNGRYAGGWAYGYSSFSLDIGPYLWPGATNILAIRLDNPPLSSRWYPGGGIYRNVWLLKTEAIHVARYGAIVCPSDPARFAESSASTKRGAVDIDLKITVDNDSLSEAEIRVSASLFELDANGKRAFRPAALSPPKYLVLCRMSKGVALLRARLADPKLWSVDKPNRYSAVVTIERDGAIVDVYETYFGLRSIRFDADEGFFLNGKHLRINGVNDHGDLGALGTALNDSALWRRLKLLKEMGCNAIRTSHHPPAPELLELCDMMGFLVVDEAFDCWREGKSRNDYHLLFDDWSEKDLRNLVRRDRGHPSVISWSIGNEVREQCMPGGDVIGSRLSRIVHEEDPTRPVTASFDKLEAGFNGFQNIVDVFGYNYLRESNQYSNFHTSNPTCPLYSAESAATISSRGEYAFPPTIMFDRKDGGAILEAHPQMSSYDLYAPPWATTPDAEFAAQDRSPFVAGEFVWTGWDYLGEPIRNTSLVGGSQYLGGGPFDPARSSYFGIIDLAGFKKDRFFLYQARWRPDLPIAHILPHWNWPERLGLTVPVMVYTSGDSAELFLNGKTLGKKVKAKYEYRLRWDAVAYEPGELRAVCYKEGRVWAADRVRTAGPAARIELVPDRRHIVADGLDLCFVSMRIVDEVGILVPRAKNLLQVDVLGPGELVALDNGDPTNFDSFKSHKMAAFNGLCVAIVRTERGQKGRINIVVSSAGLKGVEIALNSA